MKIIIVLLCGVACQVFAQTHGVFPAKILSGQKMVSESSDLYITCSTFGTKVLPGAQGFMHLCKDGRVVKKKRQRSNQNDAVFIISAGLHNSGNYSCTYSAKDLPLSTATITGLNVIPICVIASFHPAGISVAGPPAVSEGDDVELTCFVSGALQMLAGCPLIPSYLMRNGSVEQIKAFNVARMEVNFTIKDAALRDSGHYSCVVLPSKCTRAEGEMAVCGNNEVFVEVKGMSFNRQSVIFGGIIVVLAVALGFCFFKKQQTAETNSESYYQSVTYQQSRVLEEQEIEYNNVEAPSDDTFSADEESTYCNIEDSGNQDVYHQYSLISSPSGRRAVPDVLALTGSDDVNSVSPGVQGMDDDLDADPMEKML